MTIKEHFLNLCESLMENLESSEFLACWLSAEESDFVRFNQNRVRQIGHVKQLELTLNLVANNHHVSSECTLSGDFAHDSRRLKSILGEMRTQLEFAAPDPYLSFSSNVINTDDTSEHSVLPFQQAISDIITNADGLDLVGFFASGAVYRGFANTLGQRNWYSNSSFNFDWSCYLRSDKAVKSSYAGFQWSSQEILEKLEKVRSQLNYLEKTPKTISPGKYRVFLAPSAVAEIVALLGWNSFGLKSYKTKQSALMKLANEERQLDPTINLVEDNLNGCGPRFTSNGFIKPDSVSLIANGKFANCLVSARSGKEYNYQVNASHESPVSLNFTAGTLPQAEILQALDCGIYINNLWYSNYSDLNNCAITGMTRFACFWVDKGRIQAPIEVMRFDDSVYRILASKLLAMTAHQEAIFNTDTYERRSLSTMRLPGLLIKDFNLTL